MSTSTSTSKLYTASAKLFQAEYLRALDNGNPIAAAALARLAHAMADAFYASNSHFDQKRWLCACGL
jgi:hypothetical protein